MNYGATPQDWTHLSQVLGLTEDLLPVVSNPNAKISKASKMAAVGKTPSQYNAQGFAVGVPDWTSKRTTEAEIERWRQKPDYGICLQTRTVRALDIDVDDAGIAAAIRRRFVEELDQDLPARTRSNSGKQLLVFTLPGEYYKRKVKTAHGIVEFLATGQQFIAVGQHTSGVRYEWPDGLPETVPEVSPEQFEQAWAAIVAEFGIEGAQESSAPTKAAKLQDVHANDPVSQALYDQGLVLGATREGRLDITCPFEHEHTGPSSESSTSYYPPNTGGYALGHFKCLHAHCEHRNDSEFETAIGLGPENDFEDISDQPMEPPKPAANPLRFAPVQAALFADGAQPRWIIKGVLPDAEVGVMFGASGSGKSFQAIDIAGAIATGTDWRGLKTKGGRVVYVAAEGAGGCRNRMRAYASAHHIALSDIDMFFIPHAPNFMDKKDVLDLLAAIEPLGEVRLIVIDTWAQVTAGANENSGEDMGQALKACRMLHKATGAMVLLVHHSGKVAAAGARGWSGLRAAVDVEFEVQRSEDRRVMAVTKQKDGDDSYNNEFGFRLTPVALYEDEDGETVESCRVTYTDDDRGSLAQTTKPEDIEFLDALAEECKAGPVWLGTLTAGKKRAYRTKLNALIEKGLVIEDNEMISLAVPKDDLL